MIFSVHSNNLTYSVEFSLELLTIKILESVSVFFSSNGCSNSKRHIIEIMRRDFSENHQMQVPRSESQLGMMGMMSQNADQFKMVYPEVPDSRHVAQRLRTTFSSRGKKKGLWRTQLQSM